MNCKKCGMQLEADSRFCTTCGTGVEVEAAVTQPNNVEPPQSSPPETSGQNPQVYGQPNVGDYNQQGYNPQPNAGVGYNPQTTNQQPNTGGYPQQGYNQPPNMGGYPAQQAPGYYGAAPPPKPTNALISDSLAALKGLCSPKPEGSVKTAMESTSHTWAIHGAIFVLVAALFMVLFTGNIVSHLLDGAPLAMVREVRSEAQSGIFGTVLVIAILQLFGMMGGIKLMFVLLKIDVPFLKVMNLVGASTLLYTAMSLVALLISFFSIGFGAMIAIYLIILWASIYHFAMLCSGMKFAADGKVSLFWPSLTIVVSNAVSLAIAFAIIDFNRFEYVVDFFGLF